MDNYPTHKNTEVRDWLDDNPRIHIYFTPTSGSRLNLVEVWFGFIQRQAIGRGTFTWTKTADQVLAKVNRQKTFNSSYESQRYHRAPPTSPDVRSGDTSPSSWIRRSP